MSVTCVIRRDRIIFRFHMRGDERTMTIGSAHDPEQARRVEFTLRNYVDASAFAFVSFSALMLAWYSSMLETPLGIPFHIRPCSSMSFALMSIAFFQDGRAIMLSCQALTCGKPLNLDSSGHIKTTSSQSFQGTNARSAIVIMSPTSHFLSVKPCSSTPQIRFASST